MPADKTNDAAAAVPTAPPRGDPQPDRERDDISDINDHTRNDIDSMDDLDVEAALLAVSEDLHGPTQDVDLSKLSPTEKQALLRYLRERLGIVTPPV
jgi:hypothetical protein